MKIVLNHKCNFTKEEFITYQENLNKMKLSHDVVLCPSTLYLSLCNPSSFSLGSQDVSCLESGSHTGDISALQLKSMGVDYTIVGHSERRLEHKEDNSLIQEKIKSLLKQNIIPILCIGETKEERNEGFIQQKLEEQLSILNHLEDKEKVIIAYEPIWAIGTGEVPEVFEIDEVLQFIRKLYPANTLLYGGSANDKNIQNLKLSKYIQGYLLGGVSLNLEKLQVFLELC